MFSRAEQIDLSGIVAHIPTNAFKAASAIGKAVSHDADFGFRGRNKLAIHEDGFRVHRSVDPATLLDIPPLRYSAGKSSRRYLRLLACAAGQQLPSGVISALGRPGSYIIPCTAWIVQALSPGRQAIILSLVFLDTCRQRQPSEDTFAQRGKN